jgi:hypothetical protein
MIARALAGLACALLALGCASSPFMTDAPHPALTPRPGAAMVVFLRPDGAAPNTTVRILDEQNRFLGDSLPNRCFASEVEPGERLLVGWGANPAPLFAHLAAGEVYFVEVSLRIGAISSRTSLLAPALAPSQDALAGCTFQRSDQAAGQAWLDAQPGVSHEQIRRAQEVWARYDEAERRRRQIGRPP